MTLSDRWPLETGHDLRDELLDAYADPARHYHDTLHLTEVLDRLDELAAAGERFPRLPVVLAAWFHDGVYDGRPGAEERSARWAETALPGVGVPGDTVSEVARLVRMTEHHRPAENDPAGRALSDADLAILAADPARYAAYTAAVRAEYATVPEADFRAGRAAILRDLMAKEHLFHTAHGRAAWEDRARANVAAELSGTPPA
jgi:predicted metal-dependent HD superfamily phosphohydrolase